MVDIANKKYVEIADSKSSFPGVDTLVSDCLSLPFPDDKFDFVISIAVIHHLSTPERRIESVKVILNKLKPKQADGEDIQNTPRALIYVWALEQEKSRRGYHEGMDQDVLVPWVTKKDKKKAQIAKEDTTKPNKDDDKESKEDTVVKQRYYHLYRKGELESDVVKAGGKVLESGYSRDNWYAIITKA